MTINLEPTMSSYWIASRLNVAALDPDGEDQFEPIIRDIAALPGNGGALAIILALTNKLANTSILLAIAQEMEWCEEPLDPSLARRNALAAARHDLVTLTADMAAQPPAQSS